MGYKEYLWDDKEKMFQDYEAAKYSAYVSDLQKKEDAFKKQVGGNHYKEFAIQPVEFCYKNNIPYLEATAIKYLCRWKNKGGVEDLEKAKHYIDLLIEFENGNR